MPGNNTTPRNPARLTLPASLHDREGSCPHFGYKILRDHGKPPPPWCWFPRGSAYHASLLSQRPSPRSITRGKARGAKCENADQSRCLVIEATIQLW